MVNEYLAVFRELRKFVCALEGCVSHWRVGGLCAEFLGIKNKFIRLNRVKVRNLFLVRDCH